MRARVPRFNSSAILLSHRILEVVELLSRFDGCEKCRIRLRRPTGSFMSLSYATASTGIVAGQHKKYS